MGDSFQIKEHTVVVDSSGREVGMVDHVEGRLLKLTKDEGGSFGQHHYVSLDHVDTVSDVVKLLVPFRSTARH